MLKLKKNQENFEVVDGAFAGKKYIKDRIYAQGEIPENEMQGKNRGCP